MTIRPAASVLGLALLVSAPLGAQGVGFDWVFLEHQRSEVACKTAAVAGDVDRDGIPDFIMGASSGWGRAYVYSGRDNSLIWRFDGLAFNDEFGFSVDGAGDVDADGFADLVVGAYRTGLPDAPEAGSAFVFSGRTGELLWQLDGDAGDWLGLSVAGAGDVDRDGFDDVVVGAPQRPDPQGQTAGTVHVLSGRDGTEIWELTGPANSGFGRIVAGAGDANGDGFPDVIAGLPGGGADARGTARVYSGQDGAMLWESEGPGPGSEMGAAVAWVGDVDLDGRDDVLVGAPRTDLFAPIRTDAGSVFLLSGEGGSVLQRFDGEEAEERLGTVVGGAGDVDRDGFPDVIAVTARRLRVNGMALLYSGKDGRRLWQFQEYLGEWSAAEGVGDLDQDGFGDVLLCRPNGTRSAAIVYRYEPALLEYGSGLAGTGGIAPRIGTGGEVPHVGSFTFQIQITDAVGGAPCAFAGAFTRTETPASGGTLYADVLGPNAFWVLGRTTSGLPGKPGVGVATLSMPVPYQLTFIGLTMYWQGFVADPGSPLPIGLTHTGGLATTIIE